MNKIILISGPPGVGKSTLSRKLANNIPAVLLDKDLIDEAFSPGDRGKVYSENIEPKVIDAMFNLLEENIKTLNVILDAPWTHIFIQKPELKNRLIHIAQDKSIKLLAVELFLDEAVLFERIKKRGLDRDQVKLSEEGWELFKTTDKIFERIDLDHYAIDAKQDQQSIYKLAMHYIKDHP